MTKLSTLLVIMGWRVFFVGRLRDNADNLTGFDTPPQTKTLHQKHINHTHKV